MHVTSVAASPRRRGWQAAALALLTLAAAGCYLPQDRADASIDRAPAVSYTLPTTPRGILVVGDRIAGYGRYSHDLPLSISILLSHFSPRTRWLFSDQVTASDVASSDAVVYVGDSETATVPAKTLAVLRNARHLVLIENHLAQFRAAGVAFAHVEPLGRRQVPAGAHVRYQAFSFPYDGDAYTDVRLSAGVRSVATLSAGGRSVPYIVEDGDATFINGAVDFGDGGLDPQSDGYELVVADAFSDALGIPSQPEQHLAMLRLEDVSVETPVDNLRDIAVLLNDLHVPYGIGVIPDQWIRGKHLESLDQDRGLVTVLLWAQAHGATIVLHGLHHSFHSPEDYEFWDAVHDRPLPYDSPAWMRGRIEEGLRDERAIGLDPVMWETPHYSGSPVDYAETARFFTTVWEQRRPLGWSPWVLQHDQYGQRVLPEDLGYVAVDGDAHESLSAQLDRARALLVCRECIAAGFLHPTTVSPETVRDYVVGLRSMGYVFADPAKFIAGAGTPDAQITTTEQDHP